MIFRTDDSVTLFVEKFFNTLMTDEKSHMELYALDAEAIGSALNLNSKGRGSIKGLLKGAKNAFYVQRIKPYLVVGEFPEIVVHARIFGGPEKLGLRDTDSIWKMKLDEQWLIQKLVIEWDPTPLVDYEH